MLIQEQLLLEGTVNSTSDLPTGVVGDAYVIDGNLTRF